MQISEAASGAPTAGAEPCRFPKLEECAHFHYERVQLPKLSITLQSNIDQSLHSQHTNDDDDTEWFMVQVTSGDECWLLQRNFENFQMLDAQLHQCIYDRKIFQLPDLSSQSPDDDDIEDKLRTYLERFSSIADNSVNCGPVLNWLQMDNKGHRLLVPSEESRSINTPAVAAAYSVRRYVSQARDELNLEVGDMISVIDMASPGESMWWRGKRGFQVGFFPQHCVHIIGDKVPRNMPLPPPVVGSLALTPIKPVLRKHGKLITFFRSFILNRPSRRRLKQSGILKERVFGCDLGEHLLNSGHEIPMVLKCCAEFIENNGIVDGIYRLSGITSNIQKLRNAFDEDRIPNLYTDEILQDIHSVASLLKMYFRELPNPLCTYQLYQSFVNAVQGSSAIRNSESDHDRLLKMREAVQKLPPPHYRTLEYLMRHLAKVAKHGSSTGMTTRNVAIVWAPNLLRCAELEVGGVAALQGVGVQAVVTEFLICYCHLIFCDHLPNLELRSLEVESSLSPKKCRPKSLAISTPTKLITLEEARSKHLLNKNEECSYIEVGGGPKNLPKKYHTVIELPSARKRTHKRSPLGWRSLFSKSRNSSQTNLVKNRKATTPVSISINEKSVTESDLTDMKRKLRSVKSAESLTSGHSEPASNEIDSLGPLFSLNKPPGHNRSVSHDSYFDTLQNSQNNSEGSLLDLSEIQLNFELEESEMRIFSEDESLVSSPRIQKDMAYRRILTRARPEDFSSTSNSGNPSPKKQARVVISPDSMSRKRTRLEDQLSDIQYIDCNTPDNLVSTLALVHPHPNDEENKLEEPRNKSPRNSDSFNDLGGKFLVATTATPTPQSPSYRLLDEDGSLDSTPDYSDHYPKYENILTTISITYKSPPRSIETSPIKNCGIYENVVLNPEKAVIPTSSASLPNQQASQPDLSKTVDFCLNPDIIKDERPKSLSALEDLSSTTSSKDETLRPNLSSSAICDTSEKLSISIDQNLSSYQSSGSNIQYTTSVDNSCCSTIPTPIYRIIENSDQLTPTDLSLSEIIHSSTENLSTSHSISFESPSNPLSPNVSPQFGSNEILDNFSGADHDDNDGDGVEGDDDDDDDENNGDDKKQKLSPQIGGKTSPLNNSDKRKSSETENLDENTIYQQVKFFRRSIQEVNSLLELDNIKKDNIYEDVDCKNDNVEEVDENYDSLESDNNVYENVDVKQIKTQIYDNCELKNANKKTEKKNDNDDAAEEKEKDDNKNDQKAVKCQTVCVKDLTSRFEDKIDPNSTNRLRKFYEKDSLPPCLRARNLKNQLKTRSLDEEEFKKEFPMMQRRKSMDEGLGYKTNSLPKTLNPPKILLGDDEKLNSIHLAHSSENLTILLDEELKKRERIEKYKEERRKFLQDKYRSESFKEDKDKLLSKLKIYKEKPKVRNDDSDSLDESRPDVSLKSRAAIFENNQRITNSNSGGNLNRPIITTTKKVQDCKSIYEDGDLLLRKKRDECGDDPMKNEIRRHTYETRDRDRESEVERMRRISLESRSPRKEKSSPSYCIKDMKAIFESKSKQ